MRTITLLALMLVSSSLFAQDSRDDMFGTSDGNYLSIQPILHGTFAFRWDYNVVVVDPYGDMKALDELTVPSMVLITDIHGDHLNEKALDALTLSSAHIVAPQAVKDKISENYKEKVFVLANGDGVRVANILVEAIPMYNLPESPDSRHTKGRGNGYVLTLDNLRIYISGDTEDIPEMRALEDIDIAFICMNQPYTMDVNQAADAVLDFKPKVVYPYHYRGKDGLSDVDKFKEIVNQGDNNIEVRLRNWYPQ